MEAGLLHTWDLIESLESKSPPADRDSCSDCPICYANHDASTVVTQCGHYFHKACISEWIRTAQQNGSTCPACRAVLKTTEESGKASLERFRLGYRFFSEYLEDEYRALLETTAGRPAWDLLLLRDEVAGNFVDGVSERCVVIWGRQDDAQWLDPRAVEVVVWTFLMSRLRNRVSILTYWSMVEQRRADFDAVEGLGEDGMVREFLTCWDAGVVIGHEPDFLVGD